MVVGIQDLDVRNSQSQPTYSQCSAPGDDEFMFVKVGIGLGLGFRV